MDTLEKVAKYLEQNPGCTDADACKAIGVSVPVSKYTGLHAGVNSAGWLAAQLLWECSCCRSAAVETCRGIVCF